METEMSEEPQPQQVPHADRGVASESSPVLQDAAEEDQQLQQDQLPQVEVRADLGGGEADPGTASGEEELPCGIEDVGEVGGIRLIRIHCSGIQNLDVVVNLICNQCVVTITREASENVAGASCTKQFQFDLSEGLYDLVEEQAVLDEDTLQLAFHAHPFQNRVFCIPRPSVGLDGTGDASIDRPRSQGMAAQDSEFDSKHQEAALEVGEDVMISSNKQMSEFMCGGKEIPPQEIPSRSLQVPEDDLIGRMETDAESVVSLASDDWEKVMESNGQDALGQST